MSVKSNVGDKAVKGCNKVVTLTTSYGLPTPGMALFSLITEYHLERSYCNAGASRNQEESGRGPN